jgi:hypothetical protein
MKSGRSVKEKRNSNADVMYICVPICVMLHCYVVYLYISKKPPDSNEGVGCETL